MARAVPLWPFLLFGVIEPALLVWAYVLILQDPRKFYVNQVPHSALADAGFPPQAKLLVLLLGNLGWGIWAISMQLIRFVATFWDLTLWNDMMWGNVGVSAFFHLNRWATLLGLFGRLGR
ncbi:hypothetical protein LTR02_007818 [Friedmanniomyces endolithicus]|nr:hypothetical protein LTR02_007818 [Friedmanniomyces endolithicus]